MPGNQQLLIGTLLNDNMPCFIHNCSSIQFRTHQLQSQSASTAAQWLVAVRCNVFVAKARPPPAKTLEDLITRLPALAEPWIWAGGHHQACAVGVRAL
jgi:hypothetical protein